MRWASWSLGIVGVLQHAIIAYYKPDDYVSVDFSYLVMFLSVIGALALCYMSCCGSCGYGDGCDCCEEGCTCGDGACCAPTNGKGGEHAGHGHEGHTH